MALRLAQRMPCYATAAADAGHVLAVAAHGFAALASCLPRFSGENPDARCQGPAPRGRRDGRSLFAFFWSIAAKPRAPAGARQDNWLNGHGDTSFWLGYSHPKWPRSRQWFIARKQRAMVVPPTRDIWDGLWHRSCREQCGNSSKLRDGDDVRRVDFRSMSNVDIAQQEDAFEMMASRQQEGPDSNFAPAMR
jgi:hypothetical protein